jgi:creatinine amidohydrolase/Fe(II)-dependent formamide hydrolase-like protein
MAVNPALIRMDKRAPGTRESGVSGDPTKATPKLGEALLRIKIDNALTQIRTSLEGAR